MTRRGGAQRTSTAFARAKGGEFAIKAGGRSPPLRHTEKLRAYRAGASGERSGRGRVFYPLPSPTNPRQTKPGECSTSGNAASQPTGSGLPGAPSGGGGAGGRWGEAAGTEQHNRGMQQLRQAGANAPCCRGGESGAGEAAAIGSARAAERCVSAGVRGRAAPASDAKRSDAERHGDIKKSPDLSIRGFSQPLDTLSGRVPQHPETGSGPSY
jgi:hypothetical protein